MSDLQNRVAYKYESEPEMEERISDEYRRFIKLGFVREELCVLKDNIDAYVPMVIPISWTQGKEH